MEIQQNLIAGRLLRRYKRFLADVELEGSGERITAHCPDPGSMRTVAKAGRRVLLAKYGGAQRKLPYGLELIHNGRCWISVHPGRANQIVREGLAAGRIEELSGYESHRSEVIFETLRAADQSNQKKTRFDFHLSGGQRPQRDCYLEVKSVTMMRGGDYGFPDSVTVRGQRHLRDLMAARESGYRAVLLFLIQRSDGKRLFLAEDIDPEYARLAREADRAGVELIAYGTRIRTRRSGGASLIIDRPVNFALHESRWRPGFLATNSADSKR